jgi:four helix bundle protein
LTESNKEYVLSKQLLRSGTAIGALVREAEHAESKADFIHKLSIALKEANETEYWIELLQQSGYLNDNDFESLFNEITELLRLLISIIKSSKSN